MYCLLFRSYWHCNCTHQVCTLEQQIEVTGAARAHESAVRQFSPRPQPARACRFTVICCSLSARGSEPRIGGACTFSVNAALVVPDKSTVSFSRARTSIRRNTFYLVRARLVMVPVSVRTRKGPEIIQVTQ
ncbi:hypothetical protein K523DRAFT_131359 [Schizophyllum commune Tattone D]|nr:hypothetical protein K523DRAFT_131359 [Schizophyllum commune Tattone D]